MDQLPTDRRKRRVSDQLIGGVLLAALIALLAWAAKPLVPVSESRFEADSTRRDKARSVDSVVLHRIDSRVGEMYCGRLPDSLRAGCR